jgi:hypothetical protein
MELTTMRGTSGSDGTPWRRIFCCREAKATFFAEEEEEKQWLAIPLDPGRLVGID